MSPISSSSQMTVVQYNTEETRTTELSNPNTNGRIRELCECILERHKGIPDVLSIQEMEYDIPGVPDSSYLTEGKNALLFEETLRIVAREKGFDVPEEKYHITFVRGNCGREAKRLPNGMWDNDRNVPFDIAWKYGGSNCEATLPFQYSVALYLKEKPIYVQVIQKLAWKTFNPHIDLSQYVGTRDEPLPDDFPLFDKAMVIARVDCNSEPVTVINTHLIPAYNFGHPKFSNIARNADQLRCLEWLLTGKTDIPIGTIVDDKNNPVSPLDKERVLALGDLNCDFRKDNPGSDVLQRIMNVCHVWPKGQTTDKGSIPLQLDYLILRNMEFVSESESLGPMNPQQLSDHAAVGATISWDDSKR